jgi:hypothetical protein
LLGKAKSFINKADDALDDSVAKVKKSKAFGSVTKAFRKAGDFVEDKMDHFEKSEFKGKLEKLAEKAEDKFEDFTGKGKNKPKGK